MSEPNEEPPTSDENRPSMSTGWKWFFRIAGTGVMLLFLTPAFFVGKYYVADASRESARVKAFGDPAQKPAATEMGSLSAALSQPAAANIRFQATYAERSPDAQVRLAAIHGLTASLTLRGAVWHPMESMIGKSALADEAEHDPDAGVKQAARDGLLQVARGGAVVER